MKLEHFLRVNCSKLEKKNVWRKIEEELGNGILY